MQYYMEKTARYLPGETRMQQRSSFLILFSAPGPNPLTKMSQNTRCTQALANPNCLRSPFSKSLDGANFLNRLTSLASRPAR